MIFNSFRLPIFIAVFHHIDEQCEAQDQSFESLTQGTKPIGHDEDAPQNSVHTACNGR